MPRKVDNLDDLIRRASYGTAAPSRQEVTTRMRQYLQKEALKRVDIAFDSADEKIKQAMMCELKLALDKSSAIEGQLIFGSDISKFQKKYGLTPSLKVGDLVVHQ